MSSENQKKEKKVNKTAIVVALRNKFFYIFYRYSNLVFLSSVACFIASILFFIFNANRPVPPQYIAVNNDGTYIQLTPLNVCKSDAEIQKFSMDAIKRLYEYDYINYADQLQMATPYFTTNGWLTFLRQYKTSKTLEFVKENALVVSVNANGVPEIYKKGEENGVCTWQVRTPVTIIEVGKSGRTEKGTVYMKIVRQSVINNPKGLGISEILFLENQI